MLEILVALFIGRAYGQWGASVGRNKWAVGFAGFMIFWIVTILTTALVFSFLLEDPTDLATLLEEDLATSLMASIFGIVVGYVVSMHVILPAIKNNYAPPQKPKPTNTNPRADLLDEDMWR